MYSKKVRRKLVNNAISLDRTFNFVLEANISKTPQKGKHKLLDFKAAEDGL